ncbi:MAG: sensor domain-containing diguanylate cyclase [Bacillota bacterium]
MQRQGQILDNVFKHLPQAIILVDHNLKIIRVNHQAEIVFGISQVVSKNQYLFDYIQPQIASQAKYDLVNNIVKKYKYEQKIKFKVGTKTKVCKINSFRVKNGGFDNCICILINDITENEKRKRELKEVKERLELAVDGAKIGIWDWNVKTNAVHYNHNWAQMLGYQLSELEKNINTWLKLLHSEDEARIFEKMNDHFQGKTAIYSSQYRLLTKSGSWKWIRDIGKVIERDDTGAVKRIVGVHIDIDQQKRAAKEIEYLSIHDELTGLYNRRYFNKRLAELRNSHQYPISLIIGDIDNLKLINDNYGHSMGDHYIKKTAAALEKSLREDDIVARIGGDEFAIILARTDQNLAQTVISRIERNIKIENQKGELPEPLTIALGSETVTEQVADLEKCFNQADQKMYQQKKFRA